MASVERELKMTTGTGKSESLPLVLLVVDDAHKTSALELALKRENFAVEVVTTIAEAVNSMSVHGPQVVISESSDSANLIPLVRTFGSVESVSVIVLTNDMSPDKIGAFGGEIVVENKTAARDVAQLARIEMMCRSAQQLDFGAHGARPEWVLRAMLSTGRSGRLILEHGAEIWFDQTNVVAVKMGTVTTVDSMAHALVLSERCALKLETIFETEGRVATQKEFVELVMPRVMRFRNALSHAVSLEARLGVDFGKLAASLKTMPDDVNRIVRLFDGHRLMRNVIVDSPFDESLTLEIATRLAERGIIAPVEKPEGTHAAPKLFEPGASKSVTIVDSRPSQVNPDVKTEFAPPVSVSAHKLEPIDPILERQLQAFNMKEIIEQAAPEAPKPLREFADGGQGVEEEAMDSAFHSAAQSNVFDGATEFERAITPIMTPQVQVLAQSEAKIATISTQITAPQRHHSLDLLEKRFFDDAIPEVVPETANKTLSSRGTRWSIYAAVALGVLVLAIFAERLMMGPHEEKVAPVVAAGPTEMKVIAVEEPVFIQETSADIDAQIAEAKGLYEKGDYPSAIYQLEQVVKSDPNATQGWMLLGLARYDANDNAGAREAADKVMTLDPKNARAHLLDATLQFDAKNKVKAHAALEKYLQLDPNGQFAAEADALLKR